MSERDDEIEKDDASQSSPSSFVESHSFFSIYKKGQGYWTRVGTAIGVLVLLLVTCSFVYEQVHGTVSGSFLLPSTTTSHIPTTSGSDMTMAVAPTQEQKNAAQIRDAMLTSRISIGVTFAVGLLGGLLAWQLMNKPNHVDFLVATDSEMKKVNWTSRKQLFGSTRIVISFMFLLVLVLFIIDVSTGVGLYGIGVLKVNPIHIGAETQDRKN